MKKLLLATVAVMALSASAAQAEIKLDLGGYFKGYAGYSDQDTANLREFDIKRKSQIYFDGETTLDNGLTVGYHGELFQENTNAVSNTPLTATNTAAGVTQLEESYLYFSGNWGRVNAGRSNGAAYLLQVAAPGADSNIDGQDISMSFFNPSNAAAGTFDQDYKQAGPEASNGVAANQYVDKLTYLTPKFNGFQAGVSYTPEVDQQANVDSVNGMEADNTAGDFENLMEAGLRYDGEFSGVGVHVGAGYTTAGVEVETAAGTVGSDDYNEWNAGLKLSFGGFGVGAAYNTDNNAVDNNGDTDTMVAGVDYTWGAYVFGASYLNSEADILGARTDELDRYTVGATYTFGPGMQFRGAVAYFDESVAAATENDATVVTIGTDIQF